MPTDNEFLKTLRATFHVEAGEHLQAISAMLLELEKSPRDANRQTAIETAYREAHSLKGASRAVDLTDIEAICQAVEGVFSSWKQQPPDLSAENFDALHQALDSIRELIDSAGGGPAVMERPKRERIIGNLGKARPPAQPDKPMAIIPLPASIPAVNAPVESEKSAVSETVRIPIARLDACLVQAEEMLSLKSSAAQRGVEIRELTGLLERWWKEWAKIAAEVRALRRSVEHSQEKPALIHFLDWNCDQIRSLESRLASLRERADQDRRGVVKQVDELLDSSKKLLMLPFSTVGDLFSKLVRDLCRDQGKEADLTIEGGEVSIDKRILEEIKDALIHILRNCVDHGIERPETRKQLNKPPRASITVTVAQVNGDKVEIRVCDDGAGIDAAKLKKAAAAQGIISEAESRTMSDEEALPLIFHSGVSTSSIITEISGRGLGMAIARAKAEKLGGRIAVESHRDAGTTLRLTLPLTLATFRGILVEAGGMVVVVPTMNVERVLRVKPADIRTVENREAISVQGRVLSLARLESVLELPAKVRRGDDATPISVLILHSADQRIAFAVDEVLREEEVLVKPLRRPLARVRNIAGATILGNGKAAPVLNVSDLMKSARHCVAAAAPAQGTAKTAKAPTRRVLVVEDSITSRTLLKGILETANYQVRTAVDGVDAFTALREEHFDLVVSDVEMPRMNGLDLTTRIRADERLRELPVVLVTALETRQERERGIDVGANAYISKSSFDQSNLLEVVRRFV